MILHRTAAFGLLVGAAFALAACGDNDQNASSNTPAPETPAPAAPAANMEAAAPPAGNEAPAANNMEAAAPAERSALALADVSGRWASSLADCDGDAAMTISANDITGGGETCSVTSSDGSGNTLSVQAACKASGEAPSAASTPKTLILTALIGDRPATRLSVDRGGNLAEYARCPAR